MKKIIMFYLHINTELLCHIGQGKLPIQAHASQLTQRSIEIKNITAKCCTYF